MEKLRILHLEDDRTDAELMLETLSAAGVSCDVLRVDSETEFVKALNHLRFDLIVSDFSLPGFNGKAALEFARDRCPDIPFIFVSGTIGEDAAIDTLTSGATDYVLKHKFSRLVPAVQRALREAKDRAHRKQSEEALRQSEEKYRRIFEESKDMIFISSPEGRILDVNPAGIELFGYSSKDELLNAPDARQFYDDPVHHREFQRTIEAQGFVRDFELKIRRKDESVVTVLITATTLKGEDGTPLAYRGTCRDVTEQRKLEARYFRAQRVESIGSLASGIAHDLNNILSPVLMAAQLLKMRAVDDHDRNTLDILESSALRGADLVKQILSFARGVGGDRGPLQLRHLIRDVENIMRETFPKSIHVETETVSDLWSVHGDSTQLHQVLMNLCVNARDAMSSGGSLKVCTRNAIIDAEVKTNGFKCDPGRYVVVEVKDTGEGIPTEISDKIFEAFFTTKQPGKGSGLGLAITHTVVRNHGGFIEVASEVGRGTTFTIYLPARTVNTNPGDAGRLGASVPNGNGELILIVDDEAAIRDFTRAVLEGHGYRVLDAADGSDGLRMFAKYKDEVRLVLTDLNMPNMSGEKLTQAIHAINPAIHVRFMSGISTGYGADAADGASKLLQKPFRSETMLVMIHEALNSAKK